MRASGSWPAGTDLLALLVLYWYKSTNTDAMRACILQVLEKRSEGSGLDVEQTLGLKLLVYEALSY
jgi:hypothetical protein